MKTNRSLAEQRLMSLTRKFNPELRKVYQQVFDDWESEGIIERVPDDELGNFGHYLPHKAVLKPTSLTTPVRPVFDASAKEKHSVSLSDCLEKGPNLLEVISSVISIRPEDRNFLRFL